VVSSCDATIVFAQMKVRANAAQDIENPIAVSMETLRMQKLFAGSL
jgi:hypothetical protein